MVVRMVGLMAVEVKTAVLPAVVTSRWRWR